MLNIGQTVQLRAKSKHGKDRINQHGQSWLIKKMGSFAGLPAVFLASLENSFKLGQQKVKDGRWVILNGQDPDFEICPNV